MLCKPYWTLSQKEKKTNVHLNICFYDFSNGYCFFPRSPEGSVQVEDLLPLYSKAQRSCHPWVGGTIRLLAPSVIGYTFSGK